MFNKYNTQLKIFVRYSVLLILSVVLLIFTTLFGGSEVLGGHAGKLVATFLLYFLLAAYIRSKRTHDRYIVVALLLLPPVALHGGIIIATGHYPLLSIPSTLAYFVGAGMGWMVVALSKKAQALVLAVSLVMLGWVFVYGYDQYLHYLDYNNVSGLIDPVPVPKTVSFETSDGDKASIQGTRGLIVLDMWNNQCGACFKKFPLFEDLYRTYRQRDDIRFYAVNVALQQNSK